MTIHYYALLYRPQPWSTDYVNIGAVASCDGGWKVDVAKKFTEKPGLHMFLKSLGMSMEHDFENGMSGSILLKHSLSDVPDRGTSLNFSQIAKVDAPDLTAGLRAIRRKLKYS